MSASEAFSAEERAILRAGLAALDLLKDGDDERLLAEEGVAWPELPDESHPEFAAREQAYDAEYRRIWALQRALYRRLAHD